jgi:hypothetical protein
MPWPYTPPVEYAPTSSGTAFASIDRFWVRASLVYIGLVILLGGSPRPDAPFLSMLHVAALLFCAFGLTGLVRHRVCSSVGIIALAAIFLLVLPLIQLLPLPLGSPGDLAEGAGLIWGPLSIAPDGTMRALFSASVPSAALILGLNVPAACQRNLMTGIAGLAAITVGVTLVQSMDLSGEAMLFTGIASRSNVTGMFENMDHYALFLACMIMVAPLALPVGNHHDAPEPESWKALARHSVFWAFCICLAAMILLSGSRSGAVAACIAVASWPIISMVRRPPANGGHRPRCLRSIVMRPLILVGSLIPIIPLAPALGHAQILDRWLGAAPETDAWLLALKKLAEITWLHWPWGSGIGSFENVIQFRSPSDQLQLADMTDAYNGTLELVMTGGLVGMILIICTATLWAILAHRVFIIDIHDDLQPVRKAGLIIVCVISVFSMIDDPLHTPVIAAIYCFAWIWASLPRRSSSLGSERRKNFG